jgi:DHA2 family multidrug resistance protein
MTPLSTIAFSTLGAELRTDGAGVYNLVRQLGCATGVAAMTALLQARIEIRLADFYPKGVIAPLSADVSAMVYFAAYTDCFKVLAVATLAMMPAVFLFRIVRPPAGEAVTARATADLRPARERD